MENPPHPSLAGVLCLCAWGSVHGACSADTGSAFLCGLELSSGAWMVGGGSARLRSHLCRWRPEDPEGRPSRPPSRSPPPVTCRARPARPRGHSFLSEHTRVHGAAGPQPRGAVYPRWFQPAQRERHTQRPRRPGSARGSDRVGTVRGHSVLRCRRFGYTGLKCIIETNCACYFLNVATGTPRSCLVGRQTCTKWAGDQDISGDNTGRGRSEQGVVQRVGWGGHACSCPVSPACPLGPPRTERAEPWGGH